MSGTAAADLERDGGGFLRGLERESAAQASSASWRGIAYSEYARWRIVSCGWCSAAQCADTTPKRNRTMKKSNELRAIDIATVQSRMLTIRNQQVLLDRDVAALYGVETREINQAIRNNPGKFPAGFVFQLNDQEFENWKSKILTSNLSPREIGVVKMGMRRAPYALTERGLYMLATILKGDVATRATLAIVNTYAQVRSMVRDMEAIQTEKAGSPEQANLLTRAGHKLAGLIGNNLSTQSRKTTIELNLALLKITHEVKHGKE